jgi:two-component system phosphate regulon sensor histidine kinase PhoR
MNTADGFPDISCQSDMEKQLGIFQGLYDLALAMTTERSVDENLTLIVQKSRRLLGTNTAFIALNDEKTSLLCWHISSGLLTESFKNLRVPIGKGLAGRVASSGKYFVVEDYYKETGPEFHEVTRAEGLISGIAVPIQIGQTNFGVLFAFNRSKTRFTKTDLDTLNLFGNLAAVEIARKRVIVQLKESEEQYRQLYETSRRREEVYQCFLNSSMDAILIYNLQRRILYVSPSFTRMFGWTKEELREGKAQFVPDSVREEAKDLFDRIIDKGAAIIGFETIRKTKDGSELAVRINASRYHDHEGNPAGISAILHDITSFKSLEHARKRAVDLLSHELMTPISIIEANLKAMDKPGISSAARAGMSDRIKRNLHRLKDLQLIVQDIVDTPTFRPTPLRLDAFIRDTVGRIRAECADRPVIFSTRLETLETAIFDQRILELVLKTLLKNAVENTPDEGEIVISLNQQADVVILEIKDYGVGIPAQDLEFIFKGFHNTRDTEQYSTRKPYAFNAGGKGLELMRLKILSVEGAFDISFRSHRCRYIPESSDKCCGRISECRFIENADGCRQSGQTSFSVLFHTAASQTAHHMATVARSGKSLEKKAVM